MDANVAFPSIIVGGDDYLVLQDLGNGFVLAVRTSDAMGGPHECSVLMVKVKE